MSTYDAQVYVSRLEEASRRVLHPGRLVGTGHESLTLRLDEPSLDLHAGEVLRFYFQMHERFMVQSARVTAVLPGDEGLSLLLRLEGTAESTESRQSYRVTTQCIELLARVADEDNCPVLDVSLNGLAVLTRRAHEAGNVVSVSFTLLGRPYEGDCCVQSVQPLADGRIRHGLHSIDRRLDTQGLKRGLATAMDAARDGRARKAVD